MRAVLKDLRGGVKGGGNTRGGGHKLPGPVSCYLVTDALVHL